MTNPFKSAKFWLFVGGTAAGLFAKSKTARKACVNGLAAGMQLKDNVSAGLQNIKEEAQDIYEDAKRKAAGDEEDQ